MRFGDSHQQITPQMTSTPRILQMCQHPRSLEAHYTTDCLLPCCRQFWYKICGKEHADHLISCLKEKYKLTEDWTSNSYCGITLTWDYVKCTLNILMPGYVKNNC